MATINVRVINAQSDNEIQDLTLPETQTIRQLLDSNQINTDQMTVRIRVTGADGVSQQVDYDLDDALQNGSTVTVTPTNIKGALA